MSAWSTVLTAAELDAYHSSTAALDQSFATKQKEFYEAQTVGSLSALMHQAWLCNDGDGYQLARSYKALKDAE